MCVRFSVRTVPISRHCSCRMKNDSRHFADAKVKRNDFLHSENMVEKSVRWEWALPCNKMAFYYFIIYYNKENASGNWLRVGFFLPRSFVFRGRASICQLFTKDESKCVLSVFRRFIIYRIYKKVKDVTRLCEICSADIQKTLNCLRCGSNQFQTYAQLFLQSLFAIMIYVLNLMTL